MAATSGIDSIAELAGGVVQGILYLCDLVDDLRDAPREAAGLKKELKALQAVLKSIFPLARAACYDAEADAVDKKSTLLNLRKKELTSLERAIRLCGAEVKTIQALVLASHHANRKGRGIAKWLKRLLSRLRMVLQKLKLQRRIRALEKREKAVCAATTAHQARFEPPFPAPTVLGRGLDSPPLPATRPGLAPSPGMALRLSPSSTPRLPAVSVPARAQTQVRTSTQTPASSPVRQTMPHASSSRPYTYTRGYVEAVLIEPYGTAERGTHNGRGQCMVLLNPFCNRPGSLESVREIVEISDEDEEPPRPVHPVPSAERTPLHPSTPSSIRSLTRPTTHASGRSVTAADRRHDESDSCNTFETAQSVDQDEYDSGSSRLSQLSNVSEILSLSEPVTPPFPPHRPHQSRRLKVGSLTDQHRDSVATHLTSFSDLELLRNPEPYQGRDSEDEGPDIGPSLLPLGRGDRNRYMPHYFL